MTLTSSDIKTAFDSIGYVEIPKGTHVLTDTVVIDPYKDPERWLIEGKPGSRLVWGGTAGQPMFKFLPRDGSGVSYNQGQVEFRNVNAYSDKSGSSIFQVGAIDVACHWLTFDGCNFTAKHAYCIDMNRISYSVVPVFRNMRTAGGGALRLKADTGGADLWHATSQFVVDTWHHVGSERVGPAWDFRGISGARIYRLNDSGSPGLMSSLQGVYNGPVCIRINACRTPLYLDVLKCSYDNDWASAPGCWLHEFRSDSPTSVGKHDYYNLRDITLVDSNITGGVKPVRFMGGDDSIGNNTKGVVVDLVDCESPDATNMYFGGLLWVRFQRPFFNAGEDSLRTGNETELDTYFPDGLSQVDAIQANTDRPPRPDTSLPLYEVGESLYDNYSTTPADFEDLIA